MADSRDRVFDEMSGRRDQNRMSREERIFRENIEDYLGSIDESLRSLGGSQSNARYNSNAFRDRYRESIRSGSSQSMYRNRNSRRGFMDNFEGAIFDQVGGQEFIDKLDSSLTKLADSLGVHIDDLSGEIGKRLGDAAGAALKRSKLGQNLSQKFDDLSKALFDEGLDKISEMVKTKSQSEADSEGLADVLSDDYDDMGSFFSSMAQNSQSLTGMSDAANAAGLNFKSLAPMIKNVASAAAKFAPEILAAVGLIILFNEIFEPLINLIESAVGWLGALIKSANRYESSRKKRQEEAQKRLEADVRTMIEYPLEIWKKGVEDIISSWNDNLQKINATQGYDKAGLQDLMSNYAQRLRDEGLSSVISGNNLINNLSNVLDTGLSGKVAEEFAYQATLLNEAIPTQDFFRYAESYAALAANAIASGKSQSEAIQSANQSLRDFANELLYASRQLSGGFTTGLSNASDLFTKSVQIATAAGSTNYSGISNVLLGIAGQVGSVAPDLVSSVVDTIYKAATGGNSSEITALRSLAGVGASNTEFLRAFVANPQKIFSTMFNKLADIYGSSNDAFMERGEALASTFGVSFDAFQRIDFGQLATAVANMDTSNSELSANMQLLQDGQTKTTAEQLKATEINRIMIEEGLSYVIDNEAAQMIQQHMWDEQLANELMESTYIVELGSKSLNFFQDWKAIVGRIKNFFTSSTTSRVGTSPSGLVTLNGKEVVAGNNVTEWQYSGWLENVIGTKEELSAMKNDIAQMLELGKVGAGNAEEFHNLTTYGLPYGSLTDSLVNMMGGVAEYSTGIGNYTRKIKNDAQTISQLYNIDSNYNWRGSSSVNTIGKQTMSIVSDILNKTAKTDQTTSILDRVVTSVSESAKIASANVKNMLSYDYMFGEYITKGRSYEEFASSASKFGITNLDESLKAAGYDSEKLRTAYEDQLSYVDTMNQAAILQDEQDFRDRGRTFWDDFFPNTFQTSISELITQTNSTLDSIYQWSQLIETRFFDEYSTPLQTMLQLKLDEITTNQIDWKEYFTEQWIDSIWNNEFVGSNGRFTRFFDEFMNYFVNHTYYDSYYNAGDVQRIKSLEADEEQSANLALADVLTQNINDLTDPTMQTNALLAQILLIVSAIQQHNNTVGVFSLPDSLSALAMGISNPTADQVANTTT